MSLSQKKINLLNDFVNGICESCHKPAKLQPHRIQRGNQGGKYILRNILMVCSDCHKAFHENEFNNMRSYS